MKRKRLNRTMKRMWYLKLALPDGKVIVKKVRSTARLPRLVATDYYSTPHHFKTEASVLKVAKTKKSL